MGNTCGMDVAYQTFVLPRANPFHVPALTQRDRQAAARALNYNFRLSKNEITGISRRSIGAIQSL
jgi:hypothetical protein